MLLLPIIHLVVQRPLLELHHVLLCHERMVHGQGRPQVLSPEQAATRYDQDLPFSEVADLALSTAVFRERCKIGAQRIEIPLASTLGVLSSPVSLARLLSQPSTFAWHDEAANGTSYARQPTMPSKRHLTKWSCDVARL